ncbi:hypothetical protein [Nitrosospira sp. NRS527]|uniref:hypothetical protein n=1 Tax=Nitrosospira sp. NRS527 TaxID=155925 RepID=UPI001BD003F0|nr:hypothetical protein [Nitrosospira sp. NRS527]
MKLTTIPANDIPYRAKNDIVTACRLCKQAGMILLPSIMFIYLTRFLNYPVMQHAENERAAEVEQEQRCQYRRRACGTNKNQGTGAGI